MAANLLELHDVDVPEFLRTLESCKGNVYLVTREGDRLNLKSKLCQLIGFQRLLQTDRIETAHLHCTNPEDEHLFSHFALSNA